MVHPKNIVARISGTHDISSGHINVDPRGAFDMISSTIPPTEQTSVVATAMTYVRHEMNIIASKLGRQQKQDLQHSLALAKYDVSDLMEGYVSWYQTFRSWIPFWK